MIEKEVYMPSKIEAICPCCGVEVNGDLFEVDACFGFRIMGDGKKRFQSYCRSKRCKKGKCLCN